MDDPSAPEQCTAVRQMLAAEQSVYVSQLVLAEASWTLGTSFELSKPQLLTVLRHLSNNPRYHLQDAATVRLAIEHYAAGSAGFADYLILCQAQSQQHVLATLDKKLLKSAGTRKVPRA